MASRNPNAVRCSEPGHPLESQPDCCSHEAPRPLTREQQRSRRRHKVRSKSISTTRLSRWELELGKQLFPPEENPWKPQTRADCASICRPCPHVSCKYNLYLDVSERTGSIKLNFPDLEVDQMTESCVLDVADRGGMTLGDVGAAMNLTRERVRQLERSAMAKIDSLTEMTALRDLIDLPPAGPEKRDHLSADDFDEEAERPAEDGVDDLGGEGDDIDASD